MIIKFSGSADTSLNTKDIFIDELIIRDNINKDESSIYKSHIVNKENVSSIDNVDIINKDNIDIINKDTTNENNINTNDTTNNKYINTNYNNNTTTNNKYINTNSISLIEIFKYLYNTVTTEYFNKDGTLKDGVLCLIDECDWELVGCYDCCLDGVQVVTLINTIHGG